MVPVVQKSAGMHETLFDSLPALVFIVDPEGRVGFANVLFHEYFSRRGDLTAGKTLREIFSGPGAVDCAEVFSSGEGKKGIVQTVVHPASGERILRLDYLPVRDGAGIVTGVMGFGFDITEQVQMNEIKEHVFRQIEKNIEQFAILGDHLRNPLAVIIGLADMIDDRNVAGRITARAREIDDIITKIDRGWIESEKIREFMKKYYDVGIRGTHELVARAIHEEYVSRQSALGISREKNPSLRPWSELPPYLRESNLQQADDIAKKLLLIRCGIGIAIREEKTSFSFTESEVEQLAREEHERWLAEKGRRGWAYGQARSDPDRLHDCLLPWNDLPEREKDKDRHAIRALPAILARVHLKIFRLP